MRASLPSSPKDGTRATASQRGTLLQVLITGLGLTGTPLSDGLIWIQPLVTAPSDDSAPLQLQVGGVTTQAGVTLTVKLARRWRRSVASKRKPTERLHHFVVHAAAKAIGHACDIAANHAVRRAVIRQFGVRLR